MNVFWAVYNKKKSLELNHELYTLAIESLVNQRSPVVTQNKFFTISDFTRPSTEYTDPEKHYTCWTLGYLSNTGSNSNYSKVLIEGWKKQGINYFSNTHGCYAAFIYDHHEDALHIITDHYSTHTLFITETANVVSIGSRPGLVCNLPDFNKTINKSSVVDYLAAGFVLGEKTFYESLRKLPAHSLTIVNDKGVKTESYTATPVEKLPADLALADAASVYYEYFTKQVCELASRDNTNFANLTGGTDTRLILTALTPELRKEVTFISNSGWWVDDESPDVEVAKLLAAEFNLNHQIIVKSQKPEPFLPPFSKRAHDLFNTKQPKLCGCYGSETVGGYLYSGQISFLTKSGELNYSSFESFRKLLTGQGESLLTETIHNINSLTQNSNASDPIFGVFAPLCWNSFYTSIYHKYDSSWIAPYNRTHSVTVYPFLSSQLISLLMQFPRQYLQNYAIYDYLYKYKLQAYKDIPFKSLMASVLDGFNVYNPKNNLVAPRELFDPPEAIKMLSENTKLFASLNLLNTSELNSDIDDSVDVFSRRILEFSL